MNEEELLLADAREMEEEDQTLPESELTIPTNAKQLYPSAFGASYGNSTVDLSNKANNDKMLEEYDNWWRMQNGEEKDEVGEKFHQKYYNMSLEEEINDLIESISSKNKEDREKEAERVKLEIENLQRNHAIEIRKLQNEKAEIESDWLSGDEEKKLLLTKKQEEINVLNATINSLKNKKYELSISEFEHINIESKGELTKLKEKTEDLQNRINKANKEKAEIQDKLNKLADNYKTLKRQGVTDTKNLNNTISTLQQQLEDKKQDIKDYTNEIDNLKREQQDKQKVIDRFRNENLKINNVIKNLNLLLGTNPNDESKATDKINDLLNKVSDIDSLRKTNEELKSDLQSKKLDIQNIKKQKEKLEDQIKQLQLLAKNNKIKITDYQNKMKSLKIQLKNVERAFESRKDQITRADDIIKTKQQLIEFRNKKIEELSKTIVELTEYKNKYSVTPDQLAKIETALANVKSELSQEQKSKLDLSVKMKEKQKMIDD